MTRSYDGIDRYSDGYTGSGDSYTYTYNGDMLYVPAFAGYKTSYGTGEKVSFTEDELNSMGLSSTHFSLSSSYTIKNSGNTDYSLYNYLHWSGAGNVGTYTMTFNKDVSEAKFISKDGNHYYCAFMDSYPSKTVSVVPCQITLNWSSGDLIYDGTGKDVSATLQNLPSGTALGNGDATRLSVAVTYSAQNSALLVQNKPYHAGDYTAEATLTYDSSTENEMTGNFTLSDSSHPFSVGKVQMTLNPSTVTSKYGDNHTETLATAGVGVEGNWVGDDASYFDFVVKTVDDTINFATVKGSYPTTVEVTLKENATAELLTDYEFSVNQGALVINERPINGVLTINNGVYNGSEYVAMLTLDEGVRVSTDKVYDLGYVQDSVDTATAVNAGEYTVHVYKNTKTNIVEGISKTMTVEKRVITAGDISVGGLEFTYSGTSNKVTATAVGVKDQDVTLKTLYDGEETAPVNAGTYTVTFASADGNYVVAEGVSYQRTVAKANVTTPVAKKLTYNAHEQTAFENDAANRYSVGGVFKATDVSAGGYTATFTLVSDNYKWEDLDYEQEKTINVVWNIAPYGVTIEISEAAKTKVYNGVALTEEELKALFVAPEKLDGGNVEITVSVNGGEVLNTGEYVVTAATDTLYGRHLPR